VLAEKEHKSRATRLSTKNTTGREYMKEDYCSFDELGNVITKEN
jgi:hypothetical protein